MIDLHHHLLWGVDDGPSQMATSIEMARMALDEGITGVIMTPHHMKGRYENDIGDLKEKQRVLEEALGDEGIDLKLYLGHEVYGDFDTASELSQGRILTLNGSGYLLIEFPFSGIPPYEVQLVTSLLGQGIRPILAHPERIQMPLKDLKIFEDFINRGCLLQVNTGSITGLNGKEAWQRAKYLLQHGMVHLLATDAHNTTTRKPLIREALSRAVKWVGEGEVDTIVARAGDVLWDRGVRIDPPGSPKKARRFLLRM